MRCSPIGTRQSSYRRHYFRRRIAAAAAAVCMKSVFSTTAAAAAYAAPGAATPPQYACCPRRRARRKRAAARRTGHHSRHPVGRRPALGSAGCRAAANGAVKEDLQQRLALSAAAKPLGHFHPRGPEHRRCCSHLPPPQPGPRDSPFLGGFALGPQGARHQLLSAAPLHLTRRRPGGHTPPLPSTISSPRNLRDRPSYARSRSSLPRIKSLDRTPHPD